MRAVRAVLAAGVAAAVFAGCASAAPDEASCTPADQAVVDRLQARLTTAGTLRNAAVHHEASNGLTFVTAELHEPDDPDDTEGDLLTWATRDLAGDGFVAVDVYARDNADWPDADFDVRTDGAITSRGCADLWAGDPDGPAGPE